MKLLKKAASQFGASAGGGVVVDLELNVTSSVDLGGVYRATFNNGSDTVVLEVIGIGVATGQIALPASGIVSVEGRKVYGVAMDASSVQINSTNPVSSVSDSFAISESIVLATDVTSLTDDSSIEVLISEG